MSTSNSKSLITSCIIVAVAAHVVLMSVFLLQLKPNGVPVPEQLTTTTSDVMSTARFDEQLKTLLVAGNLVGPIPHILWFTYKHNVLKTKEPKQYYDNVMKTIRAYRAEWSESQAPVRFLDNSDCMTLLEQLDRVENTTLSIAFETEDKGDIKADLCRLAALFLHGGYYFDVDLEVVKPVRMAPTVSFSTVNNSVSGFFFQAFLASIPGHPLLKENLQILMEAYFDDQESCWEYDRPILGPCTLTKAWERVKQPGELRFLEEIHLKQSQQNVDLYPMLHRRGLNDNCHWVVHDPEEKEVYFYSRIVGSSKCSEEQNVTKSLSSPSIAIASDT